MDAVVAENVSRHYGDTVALDGVSLAIERGEVFGLVGPNGAGKTTLVRAITGTTDNDGTVELFGQPPQAVNRDRIGLLPQEFDPPSRLTPRELVGYYAGLYEDHRDPGELLTAVGVAGTADTYYENLSGGQKRRTCVATALVNDPDLLVLDEPTTGIDPAGRRTLWELLEALASDGTTILLTTHYMEEAQRLGDRVGLLANGKLAAVDSPETLVERYGGDSLLYIDGQFDREILEALAFDATLNDGRLTVRGVHPEEIGPIVATLEDAGVSYESLTWTEPDLEDVYLDITGQQAGDTATVSLETDRVAGDHA